MAKKNRDIEILVKLASQGNFDEAQKQLERLKQGQEGAAAGGTGAIARLKNAWATWTTMSEVSAARIKTAFMTALGPIGAIIVIVETVIRVFGKLITAVKDYQKNQEEVTKTINASSDALATAQRHKEKYADATGIEVLGKAIKTHEADIQALAKHYDDISKKVEGAGKQWWNLLGITSSATQKYQEQLALLQRQHQEAENQLRAKEKQLETEKALEKAAAERKKAEEEIADRIAKLTLDDTDFKKRELEKQLAAYEKAGADRQAIAELRAAELERIEMEGAEKRDEVNQQLASRVAQMTMDETEFKRQQLEEQVAAYQKAGADKILIDEFKAAESARIDKDETKKKEEESRKKQQIEKERINAAMGALSDLAVFQNAKSKEMAAIGKTAATSEAMISAWLSAQKAYQALVGIPIVGPALAAGAAAAALAAGFARAAAINSIPLEEGGVAEKEIFARIGEKGKKEGVLPLENPRAMRMVGEAISEAGGVGGGNVYNLNFYLPGLEAARDPSTVRAVLETLADLIERGDPSGRRAALVIARRADADRSMAS